MKNYPAYATLLLKVVFLNKVASLKGFTLVELMIVMTVMAILATLAFFGFRQAQANARDASRNQIMSSVRTQLERYYGDNQSYPVVTATQGFVTMAGLLGYPTATTVNDPGCGTTAVAYLATDVTTAAVPAGAGADHWYPAPPTTCSYLNRPYYKYESLTSAGAACVTTPCPKYKLTLVKEGGGTATFASPN
ncbi:type II secretion system protein [Candidatus Microgenomates bacterium]|nr:type II secretion system protein [Candidatus Microgenomates bacterium]